MPLPDVGNKPVLVASAIVWFHRHMNAFHSLLLIRVAAMAALVTLLAGCITNPETGRSQLLLVSESQVTQLGTSFFIWSKLLMPS